MTIAERAWSGLSQRDGHGAPRLIVTCDGIIGSDTADFSLENLAMAAPAAAVTFEHRVIEATPAAAINEIVDIDDLALWFEGAFGEAYATLAAQDAAPEGPGGGIYASDLFAQERGEATVFVPCNAPFRPSGRVEPLLIPGVELAIILHAGAHAHADRSYGALATYVADHALAATGRSASTTCPAATTPPTTHNG